MRVRVWVEQDSPSGPGWVQSGPGRTDPDRPPRAAVDLYTPEEQETGS